MTNTELNQKKILLNQIITDLEIAKETINEQGFLAIEEVNRIIDKVKKVKEIEDKEEEEAEKDRAGEELDDFDRDRKQEITNDLMDENKPKEEEIQ